ncbi:MAG: GH92 family glycosyl hydrolase [Prevotella sp.]|nr:GH92 family glycosyl hydrolase [Prevotella sp.]
MATLTLALTLPLTAVAQKNGQHTPEQTGGVYYAYHFKDSKLTAPPKGYEPFYISHYGRHGSRWLTKKERYEYVYDHFLESENLTKEGISVRQKLYKVMTDADGNAGQLSPVGAQQQREIAERMMKRFPEVLKGKKTVVARSSTSRRCVKSMNAFAGQLKKMNEDLWITQDADERHMAYIAYTSPEVEELYATLKQPFFGQTDRLMRALFRDPTRVKDPVRLMEQLHTIAADMQDVGLKVDLFDIFTYQEMQDLEDWHDQRMRLINGEDAANNDAPEMSATSLWQNIVESADAAIAGNAIAADLRFGHDTCLMRLLTLLGINLGNDMFNIVPMAANLQMVFYRNDRGDVLVKFMHNETEVKLPMPTTLGYYYHWNEVKAYYNKWQRLARRRDRVTTLNTMVGTDRTSMASASIYAQGTERQGQTIPAVLEPNGMNFWTPQTRDTEQKCVAPYYYGDTRWMGFRNSHWMNGGCTQDYGSFTVSVLGDSLRTTPEQRATPFEHAQETSHPDYYSVKLPWEHITAELTGRSHSAIMRFTCDGPSKTYLVINPNSDEGEGFIAIDTLRHYVYGFNPVHRIYQGDGEKAGFSGFFVVHYDKKPSSYGTYCGNQVYTGQTEIGYQKNIGFWLCFDTKRDEQILVKAASSFNDVEGAERNLQKEIPDWNFNKVRNQLNEIWQQRLGLIEVETDDADAENQFYGALYRASFLPREFSDVDGRYPGFNATDTQQAYRGAKYYTDFSMWDTYRALHPLLNIIAPKTNGEMMQSLVDMYEQGGWLPIFPCWNSYTGAMIGDHCISALSDAYIKGVKNFDITNAYDAMAKNAFRTSATMREFKNGNGRRGISSYLKLGYIPVEEVIREAWHGDEQVSRTMEYAYDDFALAQVAQLLGKDEDYQRLMARSKYYMNVIDPRTGYAQGRHSNGSFLTDNNFDQRVKFITEGAPCHYTFYAPHDPYGLMQAMGGKLYYVARLDSTFQHHRYWHGNEPCHQIPYMYNFAGEPWKTQREVHNILTYEYANVPGGLSGNEDAGQLSAWYIFSAMGFYPVCPSTPYYMLGTTAFKRVSINLPNSKTFTIETDNPWSDCFYIQRATLNGVPYTKNYITHQDIMNGGTLHLTMGDQPNYDWGSSEFDCQPR